MNSDSSAREQWSQVAANLRQYRAEQQAAWGDVDNATLGRYVAGEATPAERRRVEAALEQHPQLRTLLDLVGDVLGEAGSEPTSTPAALVEKPRPTLSFADHARRRGRGAGIVRRYAPLAAAACILVAIGAPGAILVLRGMRESGPGGEPSFALNNPPTQDQNERTFMPLVSEEAPDHGNVDGGRPKGRLPLGSVEEKAFLPGAKDHQPTSGSFVRSSFKMKQPPQAEPSLRVARELLDADGITDSSAVLVQPRSTPRLSVITAFSDKHLSSGNEKQLYTVRAISVETATYVTNPYVLQGDPYLASMSGGTVGASAVGPHQTLHGAKIDPRRQILSEWVYERNDAQLAVVLRQQAARGSVYLSGPSDADVLSGAALNDLLDKLGKDSARRPVQAIAVAADLPRRINVSSAGMRLGILKEADQLAWPEALLAADVEPQRVRLGRLMRDTLKRVKSDAKPVPEATIKEMETLTKGLREWLVEDIGELSAQQYVEAKRFLKELDSALSILRRADTARYLASGQNWTPKTVADVIDHMNRLKLRFAPALPGDEESYRALYKAMAASARQ
jgi:hypothetical protein